MSVIKKKIAGGITLNIIPTDKFKREYLSVNFLAPLDAATASLNALTVKVLRRGTVSYPDMQTISRALDDDYSAELYDRVFKRGETQVFGFSVNTLCGDYAVDGTDILGQAMGIMGEVMFRPALENGAFREEYVESEKKNLIDEINAKINNKNSWAVARCREIMCGGERFAVSELGTVDDVGRITAASLYEHYVSVIRSCLIEIFYVGPADEDRIASAVKDLMAPLGDVEPRPLGTEVIRRAKHEPEEVVEDVAVKQGKLILGFRTDAVLSDEDYHAFTLFSEIYGGSPSSKLFMNVREKLSLCYYCWAMPDAQKGVMFVSSGIENEKKQVAEDEILNQLRNTAEGDITDEEFDAAKKSLVNAYKEIYDAPVSLESWYMGRMLAGREDSPLENAEKIMSVTKEQAAAKARAVTLDTVYFMHGTEKTDDENGGDEDVSE